MRAKRIRDYLISISRAPDNLIQTQYAYLGSFYKTMALYLFGLGYPLADVRDALSGTALAGLNVVLRRGTVEPTFRLVVTLHPDRPGDDSPRATVEPAHPSGTMDYSEGDSRNNFEYVAAALASGEFDLASQIASLADDPNDPATAERRANSTPNIQRLAFGLSLLLADRRDQALSELARVRLVKRELEWADYVSMAKLVEALARDDQGAFLYSLNRLIHWHESAFANDTESETELYLCLPAVGLASLALRRGLVTREILPDDSVFFPLELLDLAIRHAESGVAPGFRDFDFPAIDG